MPRAHPTWRNPPMIVDTSSFPFLASVSEAMAPPAREHRFEQVPIGESAALAYPVAALAGGPVRAGLCSPRTEPSASAVCKAPRIRAIALLANKHKHPPPFPAHLMQR